MTPSIESITKSGFLERRYSSWFLETASTIIFLPFVLFLRLVAGTWLVSNHQYPPLAQSLGFASVLFGGWLLIKAILHLYFNHSGLEEHILPFLVVVILSTAFSDNPSLSAEKALGIAFYFFLALVLLDIRKRDWMWSGLINSVVIVSVATAALSLYFIAYSFDIYQITISDLMTRFPFVVDSLPRMPAIANLHVTISAAYYLMALPLFVYRGVIARWKVTKYFCGLSIIIVLGIVFLMRSRGAIIGIIFMLATLAIFQWSKIKQQIVKHPAASVIIGSSLGIIIVLGFYYVAVRRGFDIKEPSVVCRLQAWKIALGVLKSNPLFGSGLETFGYRFYSENDLATCLSILHVTHNDILQVLVNFGVLGLISLVYFAGKYIRTVSGHFRFESYFSAVSVAAITGMGLVTTTLYSPNIVFLLLFNLIWMLPQNSIIEDPRKTKTWALTGVGLSLMFSLGLWTLWKIEPYYQARLYVDNRRWEEAEVSLREAINRDPSLGYYRLSLAFVRNQASCETGLLDSDLLGDYLLLEDFAGELPEYRESLAVLFLENNQEQDALRQLDEATRLYPGQSLAYCLKGMVYLSQDHRAKAKENLATCIAVKPSWLDTPFWKSLLLDPGFEQEILSRASTSFVDGDEVKDPRISGLVSYYGGSYEQALTTLDPYLQDHPKDYEAYRIAGLAALRLGEYSRASSFAEYSVNANPTCIRCWTALGEIELISGDTDKARRALRISDYLGPTPRNSFLLSELDAALGAADKEYSDLVRTVSYYYYPYLYSHWLSSRWHFTNGHNACLPVGLTYNDYYLPISEAGKKLASISCVDAQELYAKAMSPDMISVEYFTDDLRKLNCEMH